MSPCSSSPDGSLVVCYGPEMVEDARVSMGDRWCFVCRKRLPFTAITYRPSEPSYYGPVSAMKCDGCGTRDGDVFPGHSREWSDPEDKEL
jgi:hypothetical protein